MFQSKTKPKAGKLWTRKILGVGQAVYVSFPLTHFWNGSCLDGQQMFFSLRLHQIEDSYMLQNDVDLHLILWGF